MKVTVDTRHDSLEEALATVRAAFGSSANSAQRGEARERARKNPRTTVPAAGRAKSAGSATARPPTKRSPAKSTAAPRTSGGSRGKSTSSVSSTSNIAPPGQADAIRAWAKQQGMEVKQAGRLPAAVLQAYAESSRS